jgi:hypothetical protein
MTGTAAPDHDSTSCDHYDGDYQCHSCGHFRDLSAYGPHYFCADCRHAIDYWRQAEQEPRWFEERVLIDGAFTTLTDEGASS